MMETQIRVKERERDTGKFCVAGFEDGGRDHDPGNKGNLWKLEKARKQLLLLSLQKEFSPADHFRLLISRTIRQ